MRRRPTKKIGTGGVGGGVDVDAVTARRTRLPFRTGKGSARMLAKAEAGRTEGHAEGRERQWGTKKQQGKEKGNRRRRRKCRRRRDEWQ